MKIQPNRWADDNRAIKSPEKLKQANDWNGSIGCDKSIKQRIYNALDHATGKPIGVGNSKATCRFIQLRDDQFHVKVDKRRFFLVREDNTFHQVDVCYSERTAGERKVYKGLKALLIAGKKRYRLHPPFGKEERQWFPRRQPVPQQASDLGTAPEATTGQREEKVEKEEGVGGRGEEEDSSLGAQDLEEGGFVGDLGDYSAFMM